MSINIYHISDEHRKIILTIFILVTWKYEPLMASRYWVRASKSNMLHTMYILLFRFKILFMPLKSPIFLGSISFYLTFLWQFFDVRMISIIYFQDSAVRDTNRGEICTFALNKELIVKKGKHDKIIKPNHYSRKSFCKDVCNVYSR